jgi:hypothetical protein
MVTYHRRALWRRWIGLADVLLVSIALTPASASAQMFFASGTGSDGPVSGVASFSIGANSITIALAIIEHRF